MELMVVVGIIGMLIAALAFPLSAAREKARDRSRLADLGQIEFALAAYVNTHGTYIESICADGFKIDGSNTVVSLKDAGDETGSCSEGANILDFMESFLGSIPGDPKGPDDPEYYYYFDPAHPCFEDDAGDPVDRPLLFAANFESDDTSNKDDVCTIDEGPEGGYMAHDPYVQLIEFSE